MRSNISRRNLLKGMGAGALGLGVFGLGNTVARAQVTPNPGVLGAVYNFRLGDWEMTVIKDANNAPPATVLASNQPEEEVLEYFTNLNALNEDNTVTMLIDILVARIGDEIAVFDAGFGAGGPGGALVETLAAIGINAEDVTRVISSHWHPDHITGLSTEGVLTFPNATVHFSQPEFDFMQAAPADVVGGAVAALQPALDAEQVVFYNDEEELLGGIMAMAAPGHTPGQMNFMLDSNGSRLLHLVDTSVNVYAQVPNPTWHLGFDADPELAVETRTRLMGIAADEGIPVMGYHFPFPGIGYLERNGEGFRFLPAAF